jgi:hypothetical protein
MTANSKPVVEPLNYDWLEGYRVWVGFLLFAPRCLTANGNVTLCEGLGAGIFALFFVAFFDSRKFLG